MCDDADPTGIAQGQQLGSDPPKLSNSTICPEAGQGEEGEEGGWEHEASGPEPGTVGGASAGDLSGAWQLGMGEPTGSHWAVACSFPVRVTSFQSASSPSPAPTCLPQSPIPGIVS